MIESQSCLTNSVHGLKVLELIFCQFSLKFLNSRMSRVWVTCWIFASNALFRTNSHTWWRQANSINSFSSFCSKSMQVLFKRPVLEAVVSQHIIFTLSLRFQSSSPLDTALAWFLPEELSNEIIIMLSSLGLLISKQGNNFPSQWTVTTSGSLFWKLDFMDSTITLLISVRRRWIEDLLIT